ncbi:hypothetical protein DPMN_097323 [Dreissena polymorpha]|uniref:Uncharacterized protein n=1 Tax=Dreissena polymorpha TaxID=45954 RepID=A0A9D4R4M8_DREPO|nr:hypothetical protein DPMN_097323 [Dreissena polymorpha]
MARTWGIWRVSTTSCNTSRSLTSSTSTSWGRSTTWSSYSSSSECSPFSAGLNLSTLIWAT